MKGIFLLLGSNIGDRQQVLEKACDLIQKRCGDVVRASQLYQTEPWGVKEQGEFINQVLELESELPAETLLSTILEIEKELGRVRYQKWHERTIDIDILYFGNSIIKQSNLTIPHPYIQERRFTLVPMCELAPEFVHPILAQTQDTLLHNCPDPLKVTVLE